MSEIRLVTADGAIEAFTEWRYFSAKEQGRDLLGKAAVATRK